MTKEVLSIRINKEDKEKFISFCNEVGMDMSTAIGLFIKASLAERKIPFEIKCRVPNETTQNAIKEANIMLETKNFKRHRNTKEFLKSLSECSPHKRG